MSVDLDGFSRDGFLRLPGAVDPGLVARWRQDALPRLRDRAATELKDALPPSPPAAFASLDPDDPRTWTWRRATLRTTEVVRFPDAVPGALGALDELLGPVGRRTKSLGNYLILSFPSSRPRIIHPLRRVLRGGSATQLHLDDPSPNLTLSGWRNALLLIVLFTDIEPRGGGTLLARGSARSVARRLHEGPADFVDPGLANSLGNPHELLEVTGRAGDVLITHPFLLHGPSDNESKRVRILANPMIVADRELRFSPELPPRCALEEITQSWLR